MEILVLKDMESELAISCNHEGFQCGGVLVYSPLSFGQGDPVEIPKQSRLMLEQRAALCEHSVAPLSMTPFTQLIELCEVKLEPA